MVGEVSALPGVPPTVRRAIARFAVCCPPGLLPVTVAPLLSVTLEQVLGADERALQDAVEKAGASR
jgi:hypothetical protein